MEIKTINDTKNMSSINNKIKICSNSRNNKIHQLNYLENLAKTLVNKNIKSKNYVKIDNKQILNSFDNKVNLNNINNEKNSFNIKHVSEKSSVTIFDEYLMFFNNKNSKENNNNKTPKSNIRDTIKKQLKHKKSTESNISVMFNNNIKDGENVDLLESIVISHNKNNTNHHRKNSSIQIDKTFKVFNENFIPNNAINQNRLSFIECFNSNNINSPLFDNNLTLYFIKLIEFLSTAVNIIRNKSLYHNSDIDLNSVSEEWVEINNDITNFIDKYFNKSIFKNIDLQKFLLLQYIYSIFMYNLPLERNDKLYLNIENNIKLFEQNNCIIFKLIIDSFNEREKKALLDEVSY